jgi:hypothetical protein
MMPPFVEAMRPHQWVKNLLVLVPLLFTPKAFEPAAWGGRCSRSLRSAWRRVRSTC